MTRDEHLAWTKGRALEYVSDGDCTSAVTSLVSDLGKHPETAGHPAIQLAGMLLMGGHLNTQDQVRDLIVGCN